jgi:hypothetical protein
MSGIRLAMIGRVRVLPLVRVPWDRRDVGEGFRSLYEGYEMSDLIFTAPGAAKGVVALVGGPSRCFSIAEASLSLSLSLGPDR